MPMHILYFLLALFWSILLICRGNLSQNSPLLLYSTTTDIRLVSSIRANNKGKPVILVKNYTYIAAIDYHFEKRKIFWVDHELGTIFSIDYDGVAAKNKAIALQAQFYVLFQTEIVNGVFNPDGLACDWITNKIYWTDSYTNHIEVSTIEGKYRKVLFWTDIDQPRAIAVVPMEGFMFWTDWGEVPKIERASMDGDPKSRIVIVTENIFWPNGLTVDYKTKTVYWIDGKLHFINRMDYNGKNVKTVLEKGFEYPFALTQFETKLFWTDWKTMAIHYFDTAGQQRPLELLVTQRPMDIHVWDQRQQPEVPSPCDSDNGGCSHLCLLASEPPGFTCACPMGIKLIDDKICADGPQELLLLARRTELCLIYLDSPDYSHRVLPLEDVKYSIAVDFDPLEKYIYWSDDEVKKIQRARLDGSDQEDVIVTEIQDPDGIAVDWISQNIYWTDTGTDRIEVVRLQGRYRKVVIMDKLIDPRGIAVASSLGWLFWSDWNEKEPKVERSNLDGSDRTQIVTERLGWPNGITLDLDAMKIYWCDAKLDKIEYANMDGTERRELINDNVPHVFGFSLMGDYLYWTDWQRRAIDRAHKQTVDQMENIMGLKAIKLGVVQGTNPCQTNNGNCSQLCLYRHNQSRVCACQIDFELTEDMKTCVKPEAFLLYVKKDSIGRIGIENKNNGVTIPIAGIKQASAVDYDTNTQRIYWSDSKLRTVMRAFVNGSDPQRVVDLGLYLPEGIAVDWLGLNVYWTDPVMHRIEVARLVGTSRRTLLWDEAFEPHGIVLDPAAGTNSIKKAAMDGRNQIKLITTVHPATSLALDYDRKRIYWAEKYTAAIISADLNGNDQKFLIKENVFEPVGLTLYGDFIYWSDNKTGWTAWPISWSTILTNRGRPINVPSVMAAVHICALPYRPKGLKRASDTPVPVLLITLCKETNVYLRNLVVRLVPDTSDCPEAVIPIQGLKAVKAIDFDPKSNFLYWIDGKSHLIKRSEASGSRSEAIGHRTDNVVVASNPDLSPFDLAVDAIGRLLFWTCASKDVINVTRLDNSNTFGSLERREGEKPRLIAIHVTKSLELIELYKMKPEIWQATNKFYYNKLKKQDAWSEIAKNMGTTVDTRITNIYTDVGVSPQLTRAFEREQFKNHPADRPQRLAVLDRQGAASAAKAGAALWKISLYASHPSVPYTGSDLCQDAHQPQLQSTSSEEVLALLYLNGTEPTCACPNGKVLQEDRRTCQVLPDCGNERFTCNVAGGGDMKDCIPIAWRCDRQKDCSDGSDELDCPNCRPDQFRCQNGQCIDKEYLCDGVQHCNDKSDEKNCCENGFQCPQTEVSSDSIPDVVRMSMLSSDGQSAFERRHVTGASSSSNTNGSSVAAGGGGGRYPRETLNPPPSPATTAASTRAGSPSSPGGGQSARYRPYRHYRAINQPPPPTPCSTTDQCDESDCNYSNYPIRNRYDGGPFPPPPTPRSHCHQESCPPSPSSRSSTYFSPLPPPPSPVASPRGGYDS
nr:unnamed protein product [Callosobruchus chinensis]